MNLLTIGMATYAAYGSCILLFGLLVLSIKQRKTTERAPLTLYAPPIRARRQVSTYPRSETTVRRSTAPSHASTFVPVAKPKVEIAPIAEPIAQIVEEAVITPELPAPVEASPVESAPAPATVSAPASETAPVPAAIPAFASDVAEEPAANWEPQISAEVEICSLSFPFEILDPIAMSNLSTIAAASGASSFDGGDSDIPPMVAYGLVELDEPRGREYEMDDAMEAEMAWEKFTAVAVHAHEERAIAEEPVAIEAPIDLVIYPAVEAPLAYAEKTADANLLSFFGLTQQPFDVTPDPSCLYLSSSHSDALTSMQQGIEHFRGFMMLIAEPGMGKTTLLHKLMEDQAESARVVFLFQTQCNSRELLCYILNELEVDHTGMDAVAMHRALNQALLEEMLRGRRFVLIVDEAQNLQEPVLETIRLLSDFETTHSKLIQIVLAGQPQLAETLMRDSLVQLRQRISVLSSLKALSAAETAEYVEYRLRTAGWRGGELFTPEALASIAETSGGVPRSINNYCFGALLKAFHRGINVVDADLMKEAAGTLNLESLVRRPQSIPALPQTIALTETQVVPAAPPVAEAVAPAPAPVDIPTPVGAEQAIAAPFIGPLPNPEVILTGTLTEKVRSQGWSKRHEYRILVTLERDPVSGLPIADRYYCCSLYVDEAQAALLSVGKQVRIKIEQN